MKEPSRDRSAVTVIFADPRVWAGQVSTTNAVTSLADSPARSRSPSTSRAATKPRTAST
jgi:hypothetical protein